MFLGFTVVLAPITTLRLITILGPIMLLGLIMVLGSMMVLGPVVVVGPTMVLGPIMVLQMHCQSDIATHFCHLPQVTDFPLKSCVRTGRAILNEDQALNKKRESAFNVLCRLDMSGWLKTSR